MIKLNIKTPDGKLILSLGDSDVCFIKHNLPNEIKYLLIELINEKHEVLDKKLFRITENQRMVLN